MIPMEKKRDIKIGRPKLDKTKVKGKIIGVRFPEHIHAALYKKFNNPAEWIRAMVEREIKI